MTRKQDSLGNTNPDWFFEECKALVVRHYAAQGVTIDVDLVHILWFHMSMQGHWTAVLSTSIVDGMYFEILYNQELKTAFMDIFKKSTEKPYITKL